MNKIKNTMLSHYDEVVNKVIIALSKHDICERNENSQHYYVPMPSIEALKEMVMLLRSVLFPGFYGGDDIRPQSLASAIKVTLDKIITLLTEQIKRSLCFVCSELTESQCSECETQSIDKALHFVESLPVIRTLLASDVEAAYNGDPAAKSRDEVIYCYPSIKALTNYRIAHQLHRIGIPFIPRIISEMAHSETGIDIHPAAQIGEHFFIDHGTGVVIGETCIIGNNVRIYQGVTLGAKSFPLDKDNKPIKNLKRHPILEDDVIVYSGATILGRVTIGKGAVIGGNLWVTKDVEKGQKPLQIDPEKSSL